MRLQLPVLLIFLWLLISCGGSQYSEEEQQALDQARKAHYDALRIFGDAFSTLDQVTELQDSLADKTGTLTRRLDMEGVDSDSIRQVLNTLNTANDQLNNARNRLMTWADSIYGLPEPDGIYATETPDESEGIGKDAMNDMVSNNIEYRELPENVTPAELLSLQQDQLEEIRSIAQEMSMSLENAKNVLAENL